MAVRFEVRHTTTYRYSSPVTFGTHRLCSCRDRLHVDIFSAGRRKPAFRPKFDGSATTITN
jgi:Bacterial transglutaminase-like N-terminal region